MKARILKTVSASSLLLALLLGGLVPQFAHAATTSFEVSGWLPYWRAATSTADVLPHLNKLTEINPFGYTVKTDGTHFDAANLNSATSTYAPLITAARAAHVRVIPTVMWSDTNAIDRVLSSPTLRKQNVNAIVTISTALISTMKARKPQTLPTSPISFKNSTWQWEISGWTVRLRLAHRRKI